MDSKELTKLIFQKAKAEKIEEVQVYIVKNSSVMFNIYEGNLEGYGIAEESALSIRGIYKGKLGYSYSEKFVEESIDELIKNLIQYAENNESKEDGKSNILIRECKKSESASKKLGKYTDEEKIAYMKTIEKEAFLIDKRVSVVRLCGYHEYTKTVIIMNDNGSELEAVHTVGAIGLSVVAREGKDIQTAYSSLVIDDLSEKYKDALLKNAVYDAVNMLGAAPIESGNFEVILRNNVSAQLFSYMSPVFLGSTVQKKLSMLKDKMGKKVAVDSLSIVDDPLSMNGKFYRTFDDEGVETYSKYLIENGVLKTFLHNTKTAEEAGAKSTGNGFRVSHKSSIDVLATNMYIMEGNVTLKQMINSMEQGIVITAVEGLHAGINTVSGNFSLSANGFFIKKGEANKPVSQITISGNFYELLQNIVDIGSDTAFCEPDMNYFGSPSLKIKSLTVSGK